MTPLHTRANEYLDRCKDDETRSLIVALMDRIKKDEQIINNAKRVIDNSEYRLNNLQMDLIALGKDYRFTEGKRECSETSIAITKALTNNGDE